MCFDKLRRIWRKARALLSKLRYNRLQCVRKCYKNNTTQGLVEKLLKTSIFLKDMISYYNVLQQVTRKRYGYYFQSCSRSLSSNRRGKAVITRYNRLQCVTKCFKKCNPRTSGQVAQNFSFSKGGDKLLKKLLWTCGKTVREKQIEKFIVM